MNLLVKTAAKFLALILVAGSRPAVSEDKYISITCSDKSLISFQLEWVNGINDSIVLDEKPYENDSSYKYFADEVISNVKITNTYLHLDLATKNNETVLWVSINRITGEGEYKKRYSDVTIVSCYPGKRSKF